MNDSITKILSEFYGQGQYDKRKATVSARYRGYVVLMYEDSVLMHQQEITEHTQQYAEDCAENWVIGVIK